MFNGGFISFVNYKATKAVRYRSFWAVKKFWDI